MISWLDAFKKIIGTVQQAGMPAAQRPTINFVSGATVVDNAANNSTDVTVTATAISGQNPVVLVNGLNSNVATSNLPSIRLAGPNAAFSIGGLVVTGSPAAGQTIDVVNTTTQLMTVVHEDAGSTAAYRLACPGGVSVASYAPGQTARFVYQGG